MDNSSIPTGKRRLISSVQWLAMVVLLGSFTTGCSIKKMAVNAAGNALAGGGTTFSSDDDPELIKAAVPFSLKLMESLLSESPKHKGLLFATSSGFTQYSYAFVQQEADELEAENLTRARELQVRARRLYVRARDYGLRGLEARHPGFMLRLKDNPKAAVEKMRKDDVPLLYWSSVSWAAAISVSKDNPDFVASPNSTAPYSPPCTLKTFWKPSCQAEGERRIAGLAL